MATLNSRGGTVRSKYAATEGWSQRKQRAEMTWQDQHGREYYATIELKTGDPTGLIQPLFQAPLMPDQTYLERNDPHRPYSLEINYERWKLDIRTARANWEREARQLSQKMYGTKYRPSDDFTSEVLELVGPPPPAIEPVIAAQQGNKWVLGLTDRVDLRLVEFFEPEDLDPELRREAEPDFRDEEDIVPRVGRGGGRVVDEDRQKARQQIVSNRPQSRADGKGTGGGKNLPRGAPKRERYPKGHAKAGQFIPNIELEPEKKPEPALTTA